MARNPFGILGRSKDEDQSSYGGGEGTCGGESSCGSSQPSQPRPSLPSEISGAAPSIGGLPDTLGIQPQTQSLDVKGLAEAMAKMMPQTSAGAAVAPGAAYDQPQRRDENYLDEMGSTWR